MEMVVRLLGIARVASGCAMVLRPERMFGGWVGEVGQTPGGRVAGRTMGVRNAALGLALLQAGRSHDARRIRSAALMGAAADLVDVAATIESWSHLPEPDRRYAASLASLGAAIGVLVAVRSRA